MELREFGEKSRNLLWDQSLWNPLYLQMNIVVKEVKNFFSKIPSKGMRIYDFGCGSKPYQVFAGSNEYIGIDIDRKNVKADIFADICDVPVQSCSADIVCSFFVLEHVYNPLDVLKEKFRILKSEGQLFMLVPLYWEEHDQPYDFWRYTRFSLIKMLEQAGFVDVEIKAINANWAILGMQFARVLNVYRYTRFILPLLNYLFFNLDQAWLRKRSKDRISNVMSYSVSARKYEY